MRLETASTGPGENIELPNYFLKSHAKSTDNRATTRVAPTKNSPNVGAEINYFLKCQQDLVMGNVVKRENSN